jgi:hypothetical protein
LKDTYEVLEDTITKQLNKGLKRIVNKLAVVHFTQNNDPVVVFVDEAPAKAMQRNDHNNNYAAFEVRAFISGDLAFYAKILGKPNISPCWCTWCMLSKQALHLAGHDPAE